MKKLTLLPILLLVSLSTYGTSFRLVQSSEEIGCYDFIELRLTSKNFEVKNPFTEVAVEALFTDVNGKTEVVEGFCDEQAGKIYLIRYMPRVLGDYQYSVNVKVKNREEKYSGKFTVYKSDRNGPIRVDNVNPWHFVYENSGKHFFWNGTTTYWMLGWKDEQIISSAIDRLAGYGVNRIRVAINGRAQGGERWSEPNVIESDGFTFKLNPWIADKPSDLDNPGFDVSRFNLYHWQKLDRLIMKARSKGIIVSIIFYVDGLDHGCDPFKKTNMGNMDEQRYYRYAIARYSGFDNIMWDVTNEYHLFRSEAWVEKMGMLIKKYDPVGHMVSVHGNADFPFRTSDWVDLVLFQSWDECGGYSFIQSAKDAQQKSGRILPQVNEEYGYEEHYSPWGCGPTAAKERPDGRSALNRSQLAWEIYMAGGYQTTGERADFGTGAGDDTGGGWINGRGNDRMTMLKYYKIIKETFESMEYWKMAPSNQLVSFGNMCLAEEESQYLIYTRAQHCRLQLPHGQKYSVTKIDPQTGEKTSLPDANSDMDNNAWQYRQNLDRDMVFVLKRIMN